MSADRHSFAIAVRVERRDDVSPGVVSLRFAGGEIVVTVASSIVVETGELAAPRDALTEDGVLRALPAPSLSTALAVPDAEWQAVDASAERPAAPRLRLDLPALVPETPRVSFDAGNTPTRIGFLETPATPAARPATVAVPRPRIRVGVRRFALLAMLVATWMLWFHARRTHARPKARAVGTPASVSATPAAIPSPASSPAPTEPNAPSAGATSGSGANGASRKPGVTPARAAADALANGDYPGAVALYDQLAAEPSANPAYAAVARSLRARPAALPK